MTDQPEKTLLGELELAVALAEQALDGVAAGTHAVNAALRVLEAGLQDLKSAAEDQSSVEDRAKCESLNHLIVLAVAACRTANETARKTHRELDRALLLGSIAAASSPEWVQARRAVKDTRDRLLMLHAALGVAAGALTQRASELRSALQLRVFMLACQRNTQALIERLTRSQQPG
jgi:hypothetical protein